MAYVIYKAIKNVYDKNGLNAGQQKYRNYFIKKDRYEEYRDDVDNMLISDGNGLEDCIVEA